MAGALFAGGCEINRMTMNDIYLANSEQPVNGVAIKEETRPVYIAGIKFGPNKDPIEDIQFDEEEKTKENTKKSPIYFGEKNKISPLEEKIRKKRRR